MSSDGESSPEASVLELQQMESPQRPSSSETQWGTPSSAPSTAGPKSPEYRALLPTPIRNNIARVSSKELDPNFRCEDIVGGVTCNIYKPVSSISVSVPVDEVQNLISISELRPSWTSDSSARNQRSNTFRKWFIPATPPHLSLTFDQPFDMEFLVQPDGSTKKPRRARTHPFAIRLKGYCSARKDGCPTVFVCGFSEQSLKAIFGNPAPETIQLSMEVYNACAHPKGKRYGELRGEARKQIIEKYNESGQMPAEFAKANLNELTDSEFHSSNRGVSMSKSLANNISREAQKLRSLPCPVSLPAS